MSISKFASAFVVVLLLLAVPASIARADVTSLYVEECASCHGADGRADTPVGRALGIGSFEGRRFTVDELRKLLRESRSHANLDASAIEGDLEALVAFLNALAGVADG